MDSQRIEQIVVLALLVILAIGCITVLRPFLSALLWALILSFSSWPLYAWLVGRLGRRRTMAASLMTLLVAAIFILPLIAAGTGLADSVAKVGAMVAVLLREGPPGPPAWVAELPIVGTQLAERWLKLERLGAGWTAELQPYLDIGLDWLLNLGVRLGEAVLQVSLSVLVTFFFFRDGAEGARRLDVAVKRLAGDRSTPSPEFAHGCPIRTPTWRMSRPWRRCTSWRESVASRFSSSITPVRRWRTIG